MPGPLFVGRDERAQKRPPPDEDGLIQSVNRDLVDRDRAHSSFAAALVNFSFERYFLTFRKALDASALKRSRMYEHVRAAIFWCDKAEAFLVIVELNGATCHKNTPILGSQHDGVSCGWTRFFWGALNE